MRHTAHLTADPALKVRSRSTGEIARRVVRYLRPYPGLAAGTIACAVLAQVFALTYPKLTQLVIDEVIDRGRAELLLPMVGALLAAFFLRDAFNSLRIRLNNVFEQGVIYDLRREVYGRLQRLPAGWFDQRSTGDLMTRVIEDVNAVERLLIDGTEQGVVSILGLAAVTTLLVRSDPGLAGLAMAPLPLLIAGAWWYTSTAHRRYRVRSQASAAMNALLMDNLQGVRQVKSFGREDHEDGRFAQRADALRQGTLRVMRAWAWYSPAMSLAAALGTVLVLWHGGRLVLAGQLTKGELVGFLLYLGMFYQPISQLHGLNQMAQAARAAGERVFDILDAEAESPSSRTPSPPPSTERLKGDVEYRDVHVRYGTGPEVLRGISFRARPGEMIALVGPTGAGKTTLVNVLPRFYEVTGGSIHIDGRDWREIPLETLRRHVAVVTQEPFLFNGTIWENLVYGRLDATREAVEEASRAAHCHEFVQRLAEGYETRVGERGVRLSVGEKQRISIARALLKDAPILVLDEATASVDTGTERIIQEALARLLVGRTSFVIAHRLGTIRRADRILVLRGGKITEHGRHEELIQRDGLYRRLWLAQEATQALAADSLGEEADPMPSTAVRDS